MVSKLTSITLYLLLINWEWGHYGEISDRGLDVITKRMRLISYLLYGLFIMDLSLRSIKTNQWSADNLKNTSPRWVVHLTQPRPRHFSLALEVGRSNLSFCLAVLVRKGQDGKAEIVIIDHGLYETLHQRWVLFTTNFTRVVQYTRTVTVCWSRSEYRLLAMLTVFTERTIRQLLLTVRNSAAVLDMIKFYFTLQTAWIIDVS